MASKDRTLRVVQVRSAIGAKPKHIGTLRSLGLGRIGKENTLPDRPEIRGMLRHVSHLVKFEELSKSKAQTKAQPKAESKTSKTSTTSKASTTGKTSTASKASTDKKAGDQ